MSKQKLSVKVHKLRRRGRGGMVIDVSIIGIMKCDISCGLDDRSRNSYIWAVQLKRTGGRYVQFCSVSTQL